MKSAVYRGIFAVLLSVSFTAHAITLEGQPPFVIDPVDVDLDAPDLQCDEVIPAMQKLSTMARAANHQATQFVESMAATLGTWYSVLNSISGEQCQAIPEERFDESDYFATQTKDTAFYASENTKARLELLDEMQLNLPSCLNVDAPDHAAACEKVGTLRGEYFDRILAEDGALIYTIDNIALKVSGKVETYLGYQCQEIGPEDMQPMIEFYDRVSETEYPISENLSNLSAEYDRITRSLDNCIQ